MRQSSVPYGSANNDGPPSLNLVKGKPKACLALCIPQRVKKGYTWTRRAQEKEICGACDRWAAVPCGQGGRVTWGALAAACSSTAGARRRPETSISLVGEPFMQNIKTINIKSACLCNLHLSIESCIFAN